MTQKTASVVIGMLVFVAVPAHADHTTMHIIEQLRARLEALQKKLANAQAQAGSGTAGICPLLTQPLYKGLTDSKTDGQVTELQKFLAKDTSVYPEGLVTGYLGALTEKAIQRFQITHGIVFSGSPSTTGFGVVGPKTRGIIEKTCSTTSPSQESSLAVIAPKGGKVLVRDTVADIVWDTIGTISRVDILLSVHVPPCLAEEFCAQFTPLIRDIPVANDLINSGKFAWRVGRAENSQSIPSGKFFVRVRDVNNPKNFALSESSFVLTDFSDRALEISFITLIAEPEKPLPDRAFPNRVLRGRKVFFVSSAPADIGTVDIYLENVAQRYDVVRGYPSLGFLEWVAGKSVDGATIPSGEYMVKIKDTQSGLTGVAENLLEIK